MFHSTTILAVKRSNNLVFSGDGQVTIGNSIAKSNANKLRKLDNGNILAGFAGSTADSFMLFDMFEKKIKEFSGQFIRSCVELAKDWRSDKILKKLEALLLVGNKEKILLVSGLGDVLEPDENVYAIGSGGLIAYSSAKSLLENTDLSARSIAEKSMKIASSLCIYTNSNIKYEEIFW